MNKVILQGGGYILSGVAYKGLPITQSTASGYISYTWKWWNPEAHWIEDHGTHGDGSTWDNDHWEGDWVVEPATSNAVDTGTVDASSSNVFVNGITIVTKGDKTIESWTNTGFNEIYNGDASPSASGIGNGLVTGGSNSVFANGSPIASNGSSVSTIIRTTSSIQGGSSNVFVGG